MTYLDAELDRGDAIAGLIALGAVFVAARVLVAVMRRFR